MNVAQIYSCSIMLLFEEQRSKLPELFARDLALDKSHKATTPTLMCSPLGVWHVTRTKSEGSDAARSEPWGTSGAEDDK